MASSPPKKRVFENAKGAPSLEDVAGLIKEGKAKNIVLLAGAGISTSAGIPDFRSPKTGLYHNLKQYSLPYPEAIFDISYFEKKPQPFFTLAKELYPGQFCPTLTHSFFRLLDEKKLLKRCYTQNVDTLERMAGLNPERIVEAHGSFASSHCIKCRREYSTDELRPRVMKGEVIRCDAAKCKGKSNSLVKADIVFFGEALPARFFTCASTDFENCDLLIVLGTSLKVHPFAGLVDYPGADCPRVLINLERVGELGAEDDDEYERGLFNRYNEEGFDFKGNSRGGQEYARDVAFIDDCDKGVRIIAKHCGWLEELEKMHAETVAKYGKKDAKQLSAEEEVDKLANAVGKATLSDDTGAAKDVKVGENKL